MVGKILGMGGLLNNQPYMHLYIAGISRYIPFKGLLLGG